MRFGTVAASEVAAETYRLTGGFHLAEDQISIRELKRLATSSRPLSELCRGRGVFRGPIFKRIYSDASHGAPYVSAKNLEAADIRTERYLARSLGRIVDDLTLREGMILITCSGMNLGRAIWTRADMDGLCASHDLIRVEIDHERVPPGYVHAFLTSRYGHASIRRQIYGGSIKHVEPSHIAPIGIPRVGRKVEEKIDAAIRKVAKMRSDGVRALRMASRKFDEFLGFAPDVAPDQVHTTTIGSSEFLSRGDGDFYSRRALHAAKCLERHRTTPLGEIATVVLPPISSRVQTDDPGSGYRYYSGHALYMWRPTQKGYLAKKSPKVETMLLDEECILVQGFGQRDGLIGQAAWAASDLLGAAVSGLMLRVSSKDVPTLKAVFAFLNSGAGSACVGRLPYGGSIPHMNEDQFKRLLMPVIPTDFRDELVGLVDEFIVARAEGTAIENGAVQLLEEAIKGAA